MAAAGGGNPGHNLWCRDLGFGGNRSCCGSGRFDRGELKPRGAWRGRACCNRCDRGRNDWGSFRRRRANLHNLRCLCGNLLYVGEQFGCFQRGGCSRGQHGFFLLRLLKRIQNTFGCCGKQQFCLRRELWCRTQFWDWAAGNIHAHAHNLRRHLWRGLIACDHDSAPASFAHISGPARLVYGHT